MEESSQTNIKEKYSDLIREREELKERIKTVNELINHFQVVLETLHPESSIESRMDSRNHSDRGLENILVKWAEKCGGCLNSYKVRRKLVDDGILTGESRDVSAKLFQTLNTSNRFEPTGKRGRWRLIESR